MTKIKEIKNAKGYFVGEDGSVYRKLKPQKLRNGYLDVSMGRDRKHNMVHRLVAETFLKKEDGKNIVNHKNGIRDDNRVENLEWVTHSENLKHSYETSDNSPIKNFIKCDLYYKGEYVETFNSIRNAVRFAVEQFGVSFTMLEKHKEHNNCQIKVRCNDQTEGSQGGR